MENCLELYVQSLNIEELAEQLFACTRNVRRFVDLFLSTRDVNTEHRK